MSENGQIQLKPQHLIMQAEFVRYGLPVLSKVLDDIAEGNATVNNQGVPVVIDLRHMTPHSLCTRFNNALLKAGVRRFLDAATVAKWMRGNWNLETFADAPDITLIFILKIKGLYGEALELLAHQSLTDQNGYKRFQWMLERKDKDNYQLVNKIEQKTEEVKTNNIVLRFGENTLQPLTSEQEAEQYGDSLEETDYEVLEE